MHPIDERKMGENRNLFPRVDGLDCIGLGNVIRPNPLDDVGCCVSGTCEKCLSINVKRGRAKKGG